MSAYNAAGRPWYAWSTRDLLVLAAIALVFALALLPLFVFSPLLDALLGPVLKRITSGLLFLPALLAATLLRRPGAALAVLSHAGSVILARLLADAVARTGVPSDTALDRSTVEEI